MSRLVTALLLASSLHAQLAWKAMPIATPSSRTEVFMVSDGQVALLFGGIHPPTQRAYNDLFAFDGTSWNLLPPATIAPKARSRFAMGFDLARDRLVLFGGDRSYPSSVPLGDTWEWDPSTSTWTQLMPANSPTPRIHSRMVYDLVGGRMLMFGGRGGAGNETWAWDGTNWTQLNPQTVPPAREQPQLAIDWSTGNVMMFGGSTSSGSGVLGDTWIWDGFDWNQVQTTSIPGGGVRNGRMTYDTLRRRMVLHGGVRVAGGFSDEVWEFVDGDWVQRTMTNSVVARSGVGFCYVPDLETSVLYRGYTTGFQSDMWTLQTATPALVTPFGDACDSSIGEPRLLLHSRPWVGETLSWKHVNTPNGSVPLLVVGTSDTVWGGNPLPASMAALGAPQCELLVSPDTLTIATGPVTLPIPQNPALGGLQLFSQLAVLEPTQQGFDLAMSKGLAITIGIK